MVKGVSIRLLDLIAHRDKLKIVSGDVGNAFVTAPCLEKVYSRAGPEFGEQQDAVMILAKALYGLRSSSRAFRGHFADFLKSLGFRSCWYDRDVWMRLRDDHSGYDYLCTHVDDFKIVAADPDRWIEHIKAVFHIKSVGPPRIIWAMIIIGAPARRRGFWAVQHTSRSVSVAWKTTTCLMENCTSIKTHCLPRYILKWTPHRCLMLMAHDCSKPLLVWPNGRVP